jgi:hypothetical protein
MVEMVRNARVSISARPIYLYSPTTGTRWVTLSAFRDLSSLDNEGLRTHLLEIQKYSQQKNVRRHPEVAFFLADGNFKKMFREADFASVDAEGVRRLYNILFEAFKAPIHPSLRMDDVRSKEWLCALFDELCPLGDDVAQVDKKLGLAAEFLKTILWLPGGKIMNGQLVFDSVFSEDSNSQVPPEIIRLGNERAREIIFDFVRDHEDVTEINVGQVVESLSKANRKEQGHRELYVVILKRRSRDKQIIKIVRLQ